MTDNIKMLKSLFSFHTFIKAFDRKLQSDPKPCWVTHQSCSCIPAAFLSLARSLSTDWKSQLTVEIISRDGPDDKTFAHYQHRCFYHHHHHYNHYHSVQTTVTEHRLEPPVCRHQRYISITIFLLIIAVANLCMI